MESKGEEEEVIVRTSELGKLWSNPDVAAAVPYEIFPNDEGSPFLDFDYSGATLRDSYLQVPHSPPSSTSGTDESDDNQWIFIDSEAIRNRFTRENRLACNSNYLSEKLAELSVVLEDIKNEAADLFLVKEDVEKRSAKVKCLIQLKAEFKSQLAVVNNLIFYEELLLEQVTRTENEQSGGNHLVLPEISNQNSQEPSLPDRIEDSSTVCDDPSTFESGSGFVESFEDVLGQDEVYEANEANITDIFACDLDNTIIDVEDHEFSSAQLIVLDELKSTLKPRRADMVNREREAYIRNYGTAPLELDESEQLVQVRIQSKEARPYGSPLGNVEQANDEVCQKMKDLRPFFLDNPNSPYYNAPISSQEADDQELNADVYEDSVVEEDNIDMFSAASSSQRPNFFAFLEDTLEGPRSRISGGIVPMYKRGDSTASEETNENESETD